MHRPCCPSWTCRLDWATRCNVKALCDRHDEAILRGATTPLGPHQRQVLDWGSVTLGVVSLACLALILFTSGLTLALVVPTLALGVAVANSVKTEAR